MSGPRHPARWSRGVLPVVAGMLEPGWLVLDPFAGVADAKVLGTHITLICVEIERAWARGAVGDATRLPFADGTFDAAATSPTFGNRMADHHEARDDSHRNTYRHALGAPLHERNAGAMQWGEAYRVFHTLAWLEVRRVLRPGGLAVVNISDHIRGGKRQHVVAWHVDTMGRMGMALERTAEVATPRNRFGANSTIRVSHESVLSFRKPE